MATAGADTSRTFASHLILSRLESDTRPAHAAAHRASALNLVGITNESASTLAVPATDRIRIAGERGDRSGLMKTVQAEFSALRYKPDSVSHCWVGPLIAAAKAALAVGSWSDAERYAEHLQRIGSRDSLTASQSAIVGEALWLEARAKVGRGETAAALQALEQSLAPTP